MALAQEPISQLPKPHYHPQASDPAWLIAVVQFHGHLGPAVIAGARVGMAGLRAVGDKGYFDIEVTCEGPMAHPPQSCFLDGLQIATGATLGKRSLHWTAAREVVVRFKNTTTGKTAELSLTPRLLDLLPGLAGKSKPEEVHARGEPAAEDQLESVARQVATMPEKELVTINRPQPGLAVPPDRQLIVRDDLRRVLEAIDALPQRQRRATKAIRRPGHRAGGQHHLGLCGPSHQFEQARGGEIGSGAPYLSSPPLSSIWTIE